MQSSSPAPTGGLIERINLLFGINLGVDAQQILHVLISILTAAGVWGVPNAPKAA